MLLLQIIQQTRLIQQIIYNFKILFFVKHSLIIINKRFIKNSISLLSNLIEYLLIITVLFNWHGTSNLLNPFAIGLLAVLIFQIILKNNVIGVLIPCVLILLSMYMILALLSEVNEFESFNSDAQRLLFIGLAYFLGTIMVSFLMIWKYLVRSTNKTLAYK